MSTPGIQTIRAPALIWAGALLMAAACPDTPRAQTRMTHDAADRLRQVDGPGGRRQSYEYDSAGNLRHVRRVAPPQWTVSPISGHRYGLVQCGDWQQCEDWAVSQGGHLATVRSAEENAWLVSTFRPADTVTGLWIGLNDLALKGAYTWASGEPVVYLNWRSGEPNNSCNGLPEDFAHIWGTGDEVGKWNDFPLVSCSNNLPSITQGVVELH